MGWLAHDLPDLTTSFGGGLETPGSVQPCRMGQLAGMTPGGMLEAATPSVAFSVGYAGLARDVRRSGRTPFDDSRC
jgi:hypothetical protein